MKLEKEATFNAYSLSKGYADIDFTISLENDDVSKLLKLYNNKKAKLTLEIEEPIFDEAERKYLSGVIRPFRDRVEYIKKKGCDNIEYIAINIKNDDKLLFPNFKKGTMYKGIELNKEYTLDDLNL